MLVGRERLDGGDAAAGATVVFHDEARSEACEGRFVQQGRSMRNELSLQEPDPGFDPGTDVTQLPAGPVKVMALVFAFMIWVGGWGFMDAFISATTDDLFLQFLCYFFLLTTGLFGLFAAAQLPNFPSVLDRLAGMV